MNSIPTIKDVALIADVHFTTVSMALRGHPRIPKVTRDRILQIANQLGYRRIPALTALSQKRLKTTAQVQVPKIAYITNRSEANGLYATAHHKRFIEGAKKQAQTLGYSFELLMLDHGEHSQSSLQNHLADEQIGGVIIGAFEPGRSEVALPWTELCAVKIDSLHIPPNLPYVANDQYHAVRTSFQHLHALGYQRIGLAVGLQDEIASDNQHLSGLLVEQRSLRDCQIAQPLFFPYDASHRDALPLLDAWIHKERLDAVISNWTNIRSLIESLGYACPQQVACASICLSRKNPVIAGMIASLNHVGERAASLLAELMRNNCKGVPSRPTRTLVKGHWTDGSSAPKKQS